MAGSKQKIIDTLQSVDTILVTVGKSPSVDELAAALGLTIFLNETGKHATAVMSGDIPPAISFLEPEKTFENSIDSLMDFVIALDKDKADHLRYKLVDDVVKIFITPYRSVITEKDLKYSKGDYNVELVLGIGVKSREDLDRALSSHGRILHDATVATIGLGESKLGDPDWFSKGASSLSELISSLITALQTNDKKMDKQVASALLTGIVSATDRFSNDRTTPDSLTVAAELMSYGANQQLIALKLREGSKLDIQPEDGSKKLVRDNERDTKKRNQEQRRKKKDNTKLSIDHRSDRADDESSKDKPQETKPPRKQGTARETEPPREITEPKRVGLTDDGEYDPVAALDQALKISEQKRVEDVQSDNDRLAEELAREIETPAPQEMISPAGEMPPLESIPEAPVIEQVQPPAVEQFTDTPQVVGEATLPPVQESEMIGVVRQNGMVEQAIEEVDGPTFGGVLNATTESAAEAKRLAESEQRNRTILTRSTPGGQPADATGTPEPSQVVEAEPVMPTFEMTPLPTSQPEETPVRDVFEASPYDGQTLVPSSPAGTLEEIDRQHRQSVTSAFEAPVEAAPQMPPMMQPELAFAAPSDMTPQVQDAGEVRDMFDLSSQPLPTPSVPIGQPMSIQTPDTPPPPPMPDFSQLPPLPSQMPDFSQVPMQMPYDAPAQVPDNLGQILPPAPQMQPAQLPNDPGQFQIPGQQ